MGIFSYIKKLKNEEEAKRVEQEKADAVLSQRIEDEVEQYRKTLEHSPIIDGLFSEFNKQPWILHRQSGKDSGVRVLRITSDTVEIEWSAWNGTTVEIYGNAVFSFTKSGYRPLEKCDFEKKRALLDVITARIKSQIPGAYSDSDYRHGYDLYSIHRNYHLPEPQNTMF